MRLIGVAASSPVAGARDFELDACPPPGSGAARRHVAMDLSSGPDENDPVSGRVSVVPFDLVVRDDNLFAYLPVWAAERPVRALISDDGHIAILVHLKAVGPIGVGFAAARH